MNGLQQIEQSYDVKSVRRHGEQLWPFLRILYFFQIRSAENGVQSSLGMDNTRKKVIGALSALQGFWRWFYKIEFLVFSDASENRRFGDVRRNKLFYSLFDLLGSKSILYSERRTPAPRDAARVENPSTVPTALIHVAATVISKVRSARHIENFEILRAIKDRAKIAVDDERAVRLFEGYRCFFHYFLRWKKPRAIFLSDYYNLCHMGLIRAAKDLRIPTIEFQHGVANREHPAYNFFQSQLERGVCPDYFFAFGPMVHDELREHGFLPVSKILLMGHPYLDFLQKAGPVSALNPFEGSKGSKWDLIIGVTLQWTDEDHVIEFVNEAARRHPRTRFILIPRTPSLPKYASLTLEPNVHLEVQLEFYSCMWFVDVHVTTYSTCALEAPVFGVPNILLDFDSMATRYFGRQLSDPQFNRYVLTQEQFSDALSFQFPSRASVRERSRALFTDDHQQALRTALRVALPVSEKPF